MSRIKRSKILIDVDDVIANNPYLQAINHFKGKGYTLDGIKSYYLQDEFLHESEKEDFSKYIIENDIYENCELVEDVDKILPILIQCLEVYPCSSCIVKNMESHCGIMFARKFDFLMREFPKLDTTKIILTGTKDIFGGFDYQLDDRFDHLRGDVKHKFLFTRWHNTDITNEELKEHGVIRVNTWKEFLENIYVLEGQNKRAKYWGKIINQVTQILNN